MVAQAFLVSLCLAADPSATENIAEILRNVRENEARYRDIEVTFEKKYSVGEHFRASYATTKPVNRDGNSFDELLFSRRTSRLVTQGEKFRLELEGLSEFGSGKKTTEKLIRAFDGTATRELGKNQTRFEVPGRNDQDSVFRPHVLLFHFRDRVALSNLLEHGEHFGEKNHKPENHQLEYEGFENLDGIPCVRLMVTNFSPARPQWGNRWQLWLATDRNYLMCRCLAWTRRQSETMPIAEYRTTRWMDLGDGVWLPAESEVKRLDGDLIRTGLQKVRWQETLKIVHARLKPMFNDDYFEKVSAEPEASR